MKIAFVGAGAFSDFSLQAYKKYIPGLEAVTVYDTNTELAKMFAANHNIPTIASSMDELLRIPSDVVVVLTPPNTHFELGRQSLAAGKNTLIEKPIAFTLEQAGELVDLANKNNCRMTANLVLRYHPIHQQIRQFVKNKKYGALRSIKTVANLAEYPAEHWYWKPEISGGFFLNTYTHFLDLYQFVSGQVVLEAGHHGDQKNGQIIQLKMTDTTAQLEINLHALGDEERVETTYSFEHATITTTGWLPEQMTITANGISPIHQNETEPKENRYQQILAAIIKDLVDPSTDPIISLHDLTETIRVPLLAESTILT